MNIPQRIVTIVCVRECASGPVRMPVRTSWKTRVNKPGPRMPRNPLGISFPFESQYVTEPSLTRARNRHAVRASDEPHISQPNQFNPLFPACPHASCATKTFYSGPSFHYSSLPPIPDTHTHLTLLR